MTVRLNDYHDLPALQALYELAGHEPFCGWSWRGDWGGWWVIVEDDTRRPLGCLQLTMSRPQACLESLCVPQAFSKRMRITIIRQLIASAIKTLRGLGGVQSVRFQLDGTRGHWEHIARRFGAIYLHQHPTYTLEV